MGKPIMKARTLVLVGLCGLPILGLIAVGGWFFFRSVTRPSLARSGGTVLVYEVDTERAIAPEFRSEEMAEALARRIDPSGRQGVTVRPVGESSFEIAIPRSGNHQEKVQRAKELIAQVGMLEFRILANNQDDTEAIAVAQAYFATVADPKQPADKKDEVKRELEDRASRGLPPLGPRKADGSKEYPWSNQWDSGQASYSWVELDASERRSLDLDNAAKNDPARNRRWNAVADARGAGRALILDDLNQIVTYSRPCTNAKLAPSERTAKEFEYFALTREPPAGQQITGQYLANVMASAPSAGPSGVVPVGGTGGVSFRLSPQGGDLFYAVTSANKPTGRDDNRFYRHLAIILDDRILSAPRLNDAVRTDGQINGNFTQQQVDQMVQILRAGALPARLKPAPVRETSVSAAGRD
jgi:SecD/SecF fusion protein